MDSRRRTAEFLVGVFSRPIFHCGNKIGAARIVILILGIVATTLFISSSNTNRNSAQFTRVAFHVNTESAIRHALFNVADPCQQGLPLSTLSNDEKRTILQLHNAVRNKYHVPGLAWDNKLAACAQDWANHRAATGDNPVHRPNNIYGENAFSIWKCCDPTRFVSTPQEVMDSWVGNEEGNFDRNTNSCKLDPAKTGGTVCGHFTQVVWSTTTTVGCGKTIVHDTPRPKSTMAYWVCNYNPPGNITGASPFGR